MRPVGILGGMGPEATILLQQKVLDAVNAREDQDHIPLLIDMNPQVPSRIAHLLEKSGEDPGPTLGAMAARLEQSGSAALAMPCNTAHFYADAIASAVHIPLLNMIDLAVDHGAQRLDRGACVGILGSPAVRQAKLFEHAFGAHGISVIWPKNDHDMLKAIRMVKADGPCNAARAILSAASQELAVEGASLQFVACSEFSLIVDSAESEAGVVDTINLLAQAIVAFSTKA